MILDQVIHLLSGALVVASLWRVSASAPALLAFVSLTFDSLVFIEYPNWLEMKYWVISLSAKDGVIMIILAIRHVRRELPLLLGFSVSCLFHQIITVEVYNQDLTLFYLRPDFMSAIISAMLASVIFILIKGGGSGGKRVKSRVFRADYNLYRFFQLQTFKVKK